MSELTTELLNEIAKNVPGDFSIEFRDSDGVNHLVSDCFEVDVSRKMIVLKS